MGRTGFVQATCGKTTVNDSVPQKSSSLSQHLDPREHRTTRWPNACRKNFSRKRRVICFERSRRPLARYLVDVVRIRFRWNPDVNLGPSHIPGDLSDFDRVVRIFRTAPLRRKRQRQSGRRIKRRCRYLWLSLRSPSLGHAIEKT